MVTQKYGSIGKGLMLGVLLTIAAGCGSNGGGGSGTIITESDAYPARKLPDKAIYLTVTTSSSWSPDRNERLAYVTDRANKAKSRGITGVNLLLDWKDLEPVRGQIDFAHLESLVKAVKSRGLYCVLRVYANTEKYRQAWPSWLTPQNTYYSVDKWVDGSPVYSATLNILPWDQAYQQAFDDFHLRLSQRISESRIQPDAFQISIGGSFGEQGLGQCNWQQVYPTWDEFFTRLMVAEMHHVDSYSATIGPVVKDSIIMLNSLYPTNTAVEDQLPAYARQKGIGWGQLNGSACYLAKGFPGLSQSAAAENMEMLARFKATGAKAFLEDENGPETCNSIGLDSSLSSRVDLMRGLQDTYGVTFNAVSIAGHDNAFNNDLEDEAGIRKLKDLLGIQ